MKNISSSLTFLYKYVFCYIWYSIGGIASFVAALNYKSLGPFVFVWIAFYIALCFLFYTTLSKLKIVKISKNMLYISEHKEEIVVQIDDIESISDCRFFTPELIYIKLKTKNVFGDKIIFAPATRLFRAKKHPIVQELNKLKMS
jgi:hypothetical protein